MLHPLNNIKITNYFNYKPRFNGIFSRNNLSRIIDGVYVTNLDYRNRRETHWVWLFINKNTAVYFDSFGIEYILQELLNKIKDKSIAHNMFRIQDNGSIMCRCYCIGFIEYMLEGKNLLDYIDLPSPHDYKKNGKIIYNYFKDKYGRRSKSRL